MQLCTKRIHIGSKQMRLLMSWTKLPMYNVCVYLRAYNL